MADPAEAPPPQLSGQRLAMLLYASGLIMIAVGIAVGIAIDPILFVIVAVGISDLVIGWLFATDRIGPGAARRKAAATGDAAQVAEADPSYNPYARED